MKIALDRKKLAQGALRTTALLSELSILNGIAALLDGFGVERGDTRAATPEAQAYRLVLTALADAVVRTVDAAARRPADAASDEAIAAVAAKLPEALPLDDDFFRRPQAHPVLGEITPFLDRVLTVCGVDTAALPDFHAKLQRAFIRALDAEQRTNRWAYDLLETFAGPSFAGDAAQRQRNWERTRHSLIGDVRKPLLNFDLDDADAVALEQVYIPLRAWEWRRQETADGKTKQWRQVIWLRETMEAWLKKGDRADPFRLISGEIGCGKSSFCKMLAAHLADRERCVLLIPLHQVRHHVDSDPEHCLRAFAEDSRCLGHDPLGPDARDDYPPHRPLLLLFDGLDELTSGGGAVERLTKRFVSNMCDYLGGLNHGGLRVQAVFAGRPLAADDVHGLRAPGQRLHVLRYRYDVHAHGDGSGPPDEGHEPADPRHRGWHPLVVPEDDTDPLRVDQAPAWWERYQAATKRPVIGLPDHLKRRGKALDDLLAQPLLNYLVAVVPEAEKARSVNDIYNRLFRDLFERETATGRHTGQPAKSTALLGLGRDPDAAHAVFRDILEHIAMAAWHGGDRTVSTTEIDAFFRTAGRSDLHAHVAKVGQGLRTILNSFFVETRDVADAYDFTHKSFREYLTARYLRGLVADIGGSLGTHHGGMVLGEEWAIGRWLTATGGAFWDMDLQGFFLDEIKAWHGRDPETLQTGKQVLRRVFGHALEHGLPVPADAKTQQQVLEVTGAAELAFIAALGACHKVLKAALVAGIVDIGQHHQHWSKHPDVWQCFPIPLPDNDPGCIPRLLTRLRACNRHQETILLWSASALLDGARIDARGQAVNGARPHSIVTVQAVVLEGCHLELINLEHADLMGARLEHANLVGARLERANLEGANLVGARLEHANLEHADLEGANLEHARLEHANLEGANLEGANLERADLSGADLSPEQREYAKARGAIVDAE